MRNILFVCCALLAFASCLKNPTPATPEDPVVTERLTTIRKFDVPVQSGYTTIVALGSDTLCIATAATSIWVPKEYPATKAGEEVAVSWVEGTDPRAGSAQMWQTIGFEDSEVGDYDYNDLVIHCKYEFKGGKFGVGVHPIALGSTKTISLGLRLFVNDIMVEDKLLCNNCRDELFIQGGEIMQGFVNTEETANFHTNFYLVKYVRDNVGTTKFSDVKVVWYIKVGDRYYYSVNDKYRYLDGNKRPYGIIMTNTGNTFYQDERNPAVGGNWFAYPYELRNINDCYPTFNDWITGAADYCDFSSPVPGTTIDLDTYKYDRPDTGPTRVYYFPTNKSVL